MMNLKPRLSRNADVTATSDGWRLTIPSGPANRYRLSQLDDHAHMARQNYPYHPPLTLNLKARVLEAYLPGTWGFGLWNDPFGFSFGPGDTFFRLPALPNAIWFFHASNQNYLSFRDDKPAQGFLAQIFRSPRFHPALVLAGLAFPFSRRRTRQYLSRVIEEDGIALSTDATQWHEYRFEWREKRTVFWVDNIQVFDSSVSPRGPLGIVIWIDNQYAAFTPEGKIGFGVLENPKPAWLEIKDIEIK